MLARRGRHQPPWPPESFSKTHWRRAPGVFRGAVPAVFDDASVLRALARWARAGAVRVTKAGAPVGPAVLPLPKGEQTIAAYLARLDRALGPEYGVVLNGVQVVDRDLWHAATRFLAGVYRVTGFPPGGALMDLFVSRFERGGLFGIHRDTQDVFTFVLAGHKRFLLWHEHDLLRLAAASRRVRLSGNQLLGPITPALRAKAIVLDADVGDLVYWPSDYWHIGDGDGSACASLGLGVFADDARALIGALASVDEPPAPPRSAGPDEHVAALGSWARGHLRPGSRPWERLEERMAQHVSRCGFLAAPDPGPSRPVHDDDVIRGAHQETLCVVRRHDEVYWSVCGHGQATRWGGDVAALFEFVRMGECGRAGDLLRAWSPARVRRSELRGILETLRRFGVVVREIGREDARGKHGC